MTVGLVLSLVARLALQSFAGSPEEQLGCLLGVVVGDTITVTRVQSLHTEAWPKEYGTARHTKVVPRNECPPDALGRVHSHPDAKNCWYMFPGTAVPTSDAVSFVKWSPYPIDAIVCGSRLVWVDRQLNQRERPL